MLYIDYYRASIGNFHIKFLSPGKNVRIRLTAQYNFCCTVFLNFIFVNFVAATLFKYCGDIESNPGPPLHHHYNVNQLTLYCVNIRSIRAVVSENPTIRKFDYLCAEASSREHSIVCVSETWLHKSDKDIDIEMPDYTMYRRDRPMNRYGGLVTYIHNSVNSNRLTCFKPADSEIMCLEIKCDNNKILLCSCYRPPNKSSNFFFDDVQNILDSASSTFDTVIFIGDMNCKHSDFTHAIKHAMLAKCARNCLILIFMISFSGNSQICIDLLFTNTTHFFNKIGTEPPLSNCDHVHITAVLNFKYKHDSSFKREVWNFKKADFDKFRCVLSTSPWQNVTFLDDVNECVLIWSDMFIKIAEACVPHQNVIIRPKDKPWMNSAMRKCINNRRKLFYEFKRSNLDSVKNDYKQLRNKIVSMVEEAKNAYEVKTESILCNTATKPKQWWSVLKCEIKGSKNLKYHLLFMEQILFTTTQKKQKFLIIILYNNLPSMITI